MEPKILISNDERIIVGAILEIMILVGELHSPITLTKNNDDSEVITIGGSSASLDLSKVLYKLISFNKWRSIEIYEETSGKKKLLRRFVKSE